MSESTYRSFDDLAAVIDSDPDRRKDVLAARERAIAEIVTHNLAEIRRARNITQRQVAQALGIGQPRVSRIERGESLQLDTLQAYVRALGARLEITLVFDDDRIGLDMGSGGVGAVRSG